MKVTKTKKKSKKRLRYDTISIEWELDFSIYNLSFSILPANLQRIYSYWMDACPFWCADEHSQAVESNFPHKSWTNWANSVEFRAGMINPVQRFDDGVHKDHC